VFYKFLVLRPNFQVVATANFPLPMNTRGWQTPKQRTSYNYFHLSNFNTAVGRKWRHFNNRFWSKWL